MNDRRPVVQASISPVLHTQIETLIDQDQPQSRSSFIAELLRLGVSAYCEQSNKVRVNLNLRSRA